MRCAVMTITYREGDLIESVIKNWKGKVEKHLVLEAKHPWQGESLPWDETEDICKRYDHVDYVRYDRFKDETNQRNWALGYLYDYDYVLIVDADELFIPSDVDRILNTIGKKLPFQDNQDCYRARCIETYFKTKDYIWEPKDRHEPTIAVNPKKILFDDCRIPNTQYQIPISVIMHHLSYLRSDERIRTKIQQFMHYDQIKEGWFDNVWMKWTPDMENIRPYGKEDSKAVFKKMPKEIAELL